jgi:hypothetical protein
MNLLLCYWLFKGGSSVASTRAVEMNGECEAWRKENLDFLETEQIKTDA